MSRSIESNRSNDESTSGSRTGPVRMNFFMHRYDYFRLAAQLIQHTELLGPSLARGLRPRSGSLQFVRNQVVLIGVPRRMAFNIRGYKWRQITNKDLHYFSPFQITCRKLNHPCARVKS